MKYTLQCVFKQDELIDLGSWPSIKTSNINIMHCIININP